MELTDSNNGLTDDEKMEKYNNTLKLMVFLFGILFMVSLASATLTLSIDTPASGGTATGSAQAFNVSTGTFTNVMNCTLFGSSSSTANSTVTNLTTNQTNSSASAVSLNMTWDTTLLEDSNDYSIYASCQNITSVIGNSSAITVTVNNTTPSAGSSLSPSSNTRDTDGTINFTSTVTANSTTACNLFFPNKNPGAKSYTMTHSGSSCWYNLASIPGESYDYLVQASDGTEDTNSSQLTFTVDIPSSSSYLFDSNKQVEGTGNTLTIASDGGSKTWLWVVIILIVVVGFVIKKR